MDLDGDPTVGLALVLLELISRDGTRSGLRRAAEASGLGVGGNGKSALEMLCGDEVIHTYSQGTSTAGNGGGGTRV